MKPAFSAIGQCLEAFFHGWTAAVGSNRYRHRYLTKPNRDGEAEQVSVLERDPRTGLWRPIGLRRISTLKIARIRIAKFPEKSKNKIWEMRSSLSRSFEFGDNLTGRFFPKPQLSFLMLMFGL